MVFGGLFHGAFQIIERLGLGRVFNEAPKSLDGNPRAVRAYKAAMNVLGHIYTMLVVIVGWVLFRAESLPKALQYIVSMFRFDRWGWMNAMSQLEGYTLVILLFGIICLFPIVPRISQKLRKYRHGDTVCTALGGLSMLILLVLSIFCLTGSDYNPFIYFRV